MANPEPTHDSDHPLGERIEISDDERRRRLNALWERISPEADRERPPTEPLAAHRHAAVRPAPPVHARMPPDKQSNLPSNKARIARRRWKGGRNHNPRVGGSSPSSGIAICRGFVWILAGRWVFSASACPHFVHTQCPTNRYGSLRTAAGLASVSTPPAVLGAA